MTILGIAPSMSSEKSHRDRAISIGIRLRESDVIERFWHARNAARDPFSPLYKTRRVAKKNRGQDSKEIWAGCLNIIRNISLLHQCILNVSFIFPSVWYFEYFSEQELDSRLHYLNAILDIVWLRHLAIQMSILISRDMLELNIVIQYIPESNLNISFQVNTKKKRLYMCMFMRAIMRHSRCNP